ncbi:MAG: UbiD family decarboxylase, partial [Thermoplasmata archaeon]|nr:UbiD family decarboxylase [Thermoplasmata archaeon]
WGLGQLIFTRYVIVVDAEVNVHDLSEVLYRVGLQADPEEDFELVHGPVDQLSVSNRIPNLGGKVGIDATRKGPDEGYDRGWPEEIRMDPAVLDRVEALLGHEPELKRRLGARPPG